MLDPQAALREFQASKAFFVGIDSDGCTFDTMELKHKECFIPNIIRHFDLQAASKYAREAAEFVNLYSRWRGINRFPALVMTLDLLRDRPEVRARGLAPRRLAPLERFIESGKPLGNPALECEVKLSGDGDLAQVLRWSQAVNDDIARMVHGVPPFPLVKESLQALDGFADLMCVSATPLAALRSEWEEHGLARFVRLIVGQEVASKKEALKAAAPHYEPGKVLMVGDAPGDAQAAEAAGALFFPVVPGEEEASWREFHEEALPRFRDGRFAGEYAATLAARFHAKLPETPPWKKPV